MENTEVTGLANTGMAKAAVDIYCWKEKMCQILSDETFIRIICLKMVTLLHLMFFELSEKLKYKKLAVHKRWQKLNT